VRVNLTATFNATQLAAEVIRLDGAIRMAPR
jgi:hypothetical protein